MWNPNGVLIQGLNDKTNFIKNFSYDGINAYFSYPLLHLTDDESKKLTKEHLFKKKSDNSLIILEFITDCDLYTRYIKKCEELQIDVRVLFFESEYSDEIWKENLPEMDLLGYEYCPIPLDEQIITDLDWYIPLSKFWKKLNQYGLFDTYKDALEFKKTYDLAYKNKEIGDGEMSTFIFKVSKLRANHGPIRGQFSD